MTFRDIIILVLLAAALGFAVFRLVKSRKRGTLCCGDCSACHGCIGGTNEK